MLWGKLKVEKQPKDLSEIEFWAMLIMSYEEPRVWDLLTALTARQEEMNMAQTLLNTMSSDQQEWENQIGYERFIRDCISRENNAYRKGEKQGLAQKAMEIAENLIRLNVLSYEQISQAIGLPLEKVKEIADRILVKV